MKDIKNTGELREAIRAWQKETFPEMDNIYSWLVKWYEEFEEACEVRSSKGGSEEDMKEELADLIIVSYGIGIYNEELGNWLENYIISGLTMDMMNELYLKVIEKFEKNKKREWRFVPQESIKIGVYKGSH